MKLRDDAIIHVPDLMDEKKVVVPRFKLNKEVEYIKYHEHAILSAAGYNSKMTLPTLAELRHAFFGGSKDYKESVHKHSDFGEWTSTFLQDGKKIIENPDSIVYLDGVWLVNGGKVKSIELPIDGWTLEYDKSTGFPSKTSQKRKDAEKIFGDDTSYFHVARKGVMAVLQRFLDPYGPFYINATNSPGNSNKYIWGRMCYRSK